MRNQKGFTLVEIAIVLVVIGLLLGGVLKGQEIVKNAKISSLQNSIKEITAAMATYQDRYRAMPGDDRKASTHLRISKKYNGNGNGWLDGSWSSKNPKDETVKFWYHLRKAGIISGEGLEQPTHAFGGIMGIQNNAWNLRGISLCFSNLSGEVARILDSKLDDGKPKTGSVQGHNKDGQYKDKTNYTVCTTL